MRTRKQFKVICPLIAIFCVGCISQAVFAKSVKNAPKPVVKPTKKRFETSRLMDKTLRAEPNKADSEFINISGKKYPKNSVGDFRRTEGLYWKKMFFKQPQPFGSAPPELIKMNKSSTKKPNHNGVKVETGSNDKKSPNDSFGFSFP